MIADAYSEERTGLITRSAQSSVVVESVSGQTERIDQGTTRVMITGPKSSPHEPANYRELRRFRRTRTPLSACPTTSARKSRTRRKGRLNSFLPGVDGELGGRHHTGAQAARRPYSGAGAAARWDLERRERDIRDAGWSRMVSAHWIPGWMKARHDRGGGGGRMARRLAAEHGSSPASPPARTSSARSAWRSSWPGRGHRRARRRQRLQVHERRAVSG